MKHDKSALETADYFLQLCITLGYVEHFYPTDRVEQDILDFLDLVHFYVLVSLLVSKILIKNVLFLSPFQDLYF